MLLSKELMQPKCDNSINNTIENTKVENSVQNTTPDNVNE